jgi:hypothetical protein
MTKFGKAGKTR